MRTFYVLLDHGTAEDIDPSITPSLIAALEREFGARGARVQVRAYDSVTLDEDRYDREIEQSNPDGVLIIKAIGGVTAYGGMETIIYDVNLFALASEGRRVWRAKIHATGGAAIVDKKMGHVAEELVRRLAADHML